MGTVAERDLALHDLRWLRRLISEGSWDSVTWWAPDIARRYTCSEERPNYIREGAKLPGPDRELAYERYQRSISDDIEVLLGSQDPTHRSMSPVWDRIEDCARRAGDIYWAERTGDDED